MTVRSDLLKWEKHLSDACRCGNLKAMQEAIDAGVDVNRPAGKGRNPAILVAAEAGQALAVQLLLDSGADPEVTSVRDGMNAAAKAMWRNRIGVLDLLLKLDCYREMAASGHLTDLLQTTSTAETAGMVCDFQFEQRPWNEETGCPGWTSLHQAAWSGNWLWLLALIRYGLADVEARDERGRTALHAVRAVRHPYVSLTQPHYRSGGARLPVAPG